jgi:hypothetical protein
VSDQSPQGAPDPQGAPGTARKRALLVINEAVSGRELTRSLTERLEDDIEEVFVVAPAMPESKLELMMGDVDDAIPPARKRLEETLETLRAAGLKASGEVGDSDPIQAMNDEVVKFHPDQIILVAHTGAEGSPIEKGLLEQAERDFELPVTELVVTREDEPEVVDVQRTKRGSWRGRGESGAYLPPVNKRDIAGIVVGFTCTLILGILASKGLSNSHTGGGNHEENRTGTEAAAMLLIALAFALINLGHIVALLLAQGVRFEGLFNRFFSKVSLIGTPLALIPQIILLIISQH